MAKYTKKDIIQMVEDDDVGDRMHMSDILGYSGSIGNKP